ncbi:unnamed protein product [Linum trigynum]|uniref:Uncharacterized protein n=1 Tax=Linum trigynum TaxID=586398 RepID=A0AAV2D4K1_9ROSI
MATEKRPDISTTGRDHTHHHLQPRRCTTSGENQHVVQKMAPSLAILSGAGVSRRRRAIKGLRRRVTEIRPIRRRLVPKTLSLSLPQESPDGIGFVQTVADVLPPILSPAREKSLGHVASQGAGGAEADRRSRSWSGPDGYTCFRQDCWPIAAGRKFSGSQGCDLNGLGRRISLQHAFSSFISNRSELQNNRSTISWVMQVISGVSVWNRVMGIERLEISASNFPKLKNPVIRTSGSGPGSDI